MWWSVGCLLSGLASELVTHQTFALLLCEPLSQHATILLCHLLNIDLIPLRVELLGKVG